MRKAIALLLFALPALAGAQAGTISPGMTRGQVVAALGEPVTTRAANEFSYLFYRNGCGKACGMNDLVVLRRDSVVDAIFRSPSRHYTGTSSSPAPISRRAASSRAPSRSVMPAGEPPTRQAPATAPAPVPTTKPKAP